jgi:predicted ATPase
MKILRLEIKGYRSLKGVSWEPADLNVVIGPNGTGKSNLLRMLQMISVAAKGGLGKYVQSSGGMEPLVWDGTSEGIEFKLKTEPVEPGRDIHRDSLTYTVKMSRLGKTSAYRIAFEELAKYYPVDSGERSTPFKFLYRTEHRASVFDENEEGLVAPAESLSEEETVLSLAVGPFSHNRFIPLFQSQLASWCIHHDLHVDSEAKIRQSVVTRLEKRVEADGQNLISVLHTLYSGDREFKKNINEAMRAAFGDDFENLDFSPAADQRIELRVFWKTRKRPDSAADISDGMLRFLFLLTVFASPSPASVIAVDEPETGLHPSMLPIVAEYAVDAASRNQVILTTHSSEFLDAFRESRPVTTVVSWSNGQTLLKKLEGESLEYWLKEYSLGSLFRSGELESM